MLSAHLDDEDDVLVNIHKDGCVKENKRNKNWKLDDSIWSSVIWQGVLKEVFTDGEKETNVT